MRQWMWAAMAVGVAVAAPAMAQTAANPVVASANEVVSRQADYIVAAAEKMPADKYGYKPTDGQWTFGKIVIHVVQANDKVCGMLTDAPAPDPKGLTETSSKEALLPALKQSAEYCKAAFAQLQDARLGDTITYFGGAKKPRARALIEVVADLEDHYSQMASYLRLNGMTPPSVKPPAAK